MELVLHVGQMKSGTTYLQKILANNRILLRSAGWNYPGQRENQQHAVYGLCGEDIFWVGEVKSEWSKLAEALVKAAERSKQRVLISAEALSVLPPDGISRLISKIGRPNCVLLTVRSLHLTLPSAWQQSVKSRYNGSLCEFFEQLAKDRPSLSGHWRTYAFGEVAQRWSQHAPVKVVVVPPVAPSDTSVLWSLFSEAAGLPVTVDTNVNPNEANISVNMETTEMLRAMNLAMTNAGLREEHMVRLKNSYLRDFIGPCAKIRRGSPVLPPAEFSSALNDWNSEDLEKLKNSASILKGDISNLALYRGEFMEACGKDTSPVAAEFALQYISYWRLKNEDLTA